MARLYELLPGNYLRARRPVPACRRPVAFYAGNPVQYRRFCLTNMLQLTVKSPLSFQWNSRPPQLAAAEKEFRCEKIGVRELKGCGDVEVWNITD